MLGHLTGRLLLSREAYVVDVPAIIEAAARTGTIIELNANPRRLDMDWRWWPLAKEKGVKCTINPDAHHTDHLQFLWYRCRRRAQGMADAEGRGELPATRKDRDRARGQAKARRLTVAILAFHKWGGRLPFS